MTAETSGRKGGGIGPSKEPGGRGKSVRTRRLKRSDYSYTRGTKSATYTTKSKPESKTAVVYEWLQDVEDDVVFSQPHR